LQQRQKIKMEVKQLQEAMDPFNLEYATSGNWWKGKVTIPKSFMVLKKYFQVT